MKRICIALIATLLLFTGCSNKEPVTKYEGTFTEYVDALFTDIIDPTSITLKLSFNDPESFGISPEPPSFGFSTQEDYSASDEEVLQILATLKGFTDDELSDQEVLDRDALIAYFESNKDSCLFYELNEGSAIGTSRSINVQLPSYLDIYEFTSVEDIEGYFSFVETLESYYVQYVELEKARQENGTGYSQDEIDVIVDISYETSDAAREPDYFLNTSFAKRIRDVSFLNDEQKDSYLAKHIELMKSSFSNAYRALAEGYKDIRGSELLGLVHKTGGKAYYERLFKDSTGTSKSIAEVKKLIAARKGDTFNKILSLFQEIGDEDLESKYYDGSLFTGLYDSELGIYNDVARKMDQDFPHITIPKYEIRYVDESQASTSSPAFYFTPKVDTNEDDVQFIYVNGAFSEKWYTTYVHEGIPGHMYQFNYFNQSGEHPIRSYLSSGANAEGWANYVENYAVKYAVSDQRIADFYAAYSEFMNMFYVELDIGINYDGWTMEQTLKYAVDEGFMNENARLEDIYDLYFLFVENPAVYPTYYVSSLFITLLKEDAQAKWGTDYSDYKFHQAILDSGSTTFDVIEKHTGLSITK